MKMIPTYRNRRCHRLGTVQPTVSTDFSNAESFPIQLPARCRLRQGAEEGCCQGAMPAETMEIHVCCHSESERLGIVEALLERGSVIIGTPFAESRYNGRGANGMCRPIYRGRQIASFCYCLHDGGYLIDSTESLLSCTDCKDMGNTIGSVLAQPSLALIRKVNDQGECLARDPQQGKITMEKYTYCRKCSKASRLGTLDISLPTHSQSR